MGHNPRVLLTDARFETSLGRWKRLDPTLKALAEMAVGGVDRLLLVRGLRLLGQRQRGRRPGASCATSRAGGTATSTPTSSGRCMAYAEAVTATPPAVTDEMVAGLRRELDDAELVELTMMVAVENVRSRFNSALGLTSQGFKDRCEIPAAAR